MYFAFFDGATEKSNPGNIGLGFTIYHNNVEVALGAGPDGFGTNNDAEYSALVWLLETAVKLGIRELHVIGDSQLIINQVIGKWHVGAKFSSVVARINELRTHFTEIGFSWVERRKNKRADALSKRGLQLQEKKLLIKELTGLTNTEISGQNVVGTSVNHEEIGPKNEDISSTVRVGRKFAVLIFADGITVIIDLIGKHCSHCGGLEKCTHIDLINARSRI